MINTLTAGGQLTIPTIDISAFRDPQADPATRAAVARAVDSAARTVGFMQITGHGIGQQTIQRFTKAIDAFFALDPAVKDTYRCPPGINRGYSPPKSEYLASSLGLSSAADLFEAFNIGTDAAAYPALNLPADYYAPNTYPSEVPDFKTVITDWFNRTGAIARTMTRIFGAALGLGEDYFSAFTDHSINVLRTVNYRPSEAGGVDAEPDELGMGAHTDYGIVTVLWADQVPGLEVLGADGSWHPVQPTDGALLVNLGDALARWTNDRWQSTMHRVTAPRIGGELVHRRSAAYFHDGNVDAVIACLPGCTNKDELPHYEPVTVAEHLAAKLRGSRAGQPNPNAARDAARLIGSALTRTDESIRSAEATGGR